MENPPPAIPQQSPTIQPQKPSQEPPVFKPSEESKKPKNKLIPLLVFLLIVALGVAGYFGWQNYQLKLEKEVVDIQPESSPVVEVDETAEWEIYTNDKYNFQFKYPSDADIEEKNNSPAGQFIVSVESNTLNVNLDIAEIDPKGSKYYLSAGPPDETEIMNQLNWDILFNKGYCDAGQCSDPFVVWQTIKDNNRFAFIFTNEVGKTDQQVQFISTFKFVDDTDELSNWKNYQIEELSFNYPPEWQIDTNGRRFTVTNPQIDLWIYRNNDPMMNECMEVIDTKTTDGLVVKKYAKVKTGEMCSNPDTTPREIWITKAGGDGFQPGIIYSYSSTQEAEAEKIFNQILPTFKFLI